MNVIYFRFSIIGLVFPLVMGIHLCSCSVDNRIRGIILGKPGGGEIEGIEIQKPSAVKYSIQEFNLNKIFSIDWDFPYAEDDIYFEAEVRREPDNSVVSAWRQIAQGADIENLDLQHGVSYFINLRASDRLGRKSQFSTSKRYLALEAEDPLTLSMPVGLALNSSENRLYVLDRGSSSITSLDLLTAQKKDVSSRSRGDGPIFLYPSDLVIKSDNTSFFVLDFGLGGILKVDIATGNRSVVSDASTGLGPLFSYPRQMRLNSFETKLYVVDSVLNALFEVDITSGDRTIVSSNSVGSGPSFQEPISLTIDSLDQKVYVANRYDFTGIFSVDLATGNRTVVASSSVGTGASLSFLSEIKIDSLDSSIYALKGGIFKIEIGNGNRTEIAGGVVGSGVAMLGSRMSLNSLEDAAYTVESSGSLLKVDLGTGNRLVTYDNESRGTGQVMAPLSIALNKMETKMIYLDGPAALSSVDLLSGDRNVLSSGSIGSGPSIINASNIALDKELDQVYIVSEFERNILKVDLFSSNRSIVSDIAVGSGPTMLMPKDIILYPNGEKAIVLDSVTSNLLQVDLNNGNRTLLTTVSGAVMPNSICADFESNKIFVFSGGNGTLIEVDLDTLLSSVVSSNSIGSGPEFGFIFSGNLELSPDRYKIYLVEDGALPGSVMSVDLTTGNRTRLFVKGSVNDIVFSNKYDLVYSADVGGSSLRAHLTGDFYKTSLISKASAH